MKFVRCTRINSRDSMNTGFASLPGSDEGAFYGLLGKNKIQRIEGTPFDSYTPVSDWYEAGEVKFLYPCVPVNLYCIGLNFRDHVKELELEVPEQPANFLKPVTGAVNPGEPIVIPRVSKQTDYEGEMAIVIKDRIKNVSEAEALDHVLGITPLNDVTERILSYTSTLVTYSKSFDTFTSFGPVIDTDIDPENTVIRTYLNGKQVQEGRTKDFIFSCAYIVSFLSQGRTLFPGDVISTGTPSHVLQMHAGDEVKVTIEGIDMPLINPVLEE